VSVDTSHTTARFFRAGHPPAAPLLAPILLSIAFRVVRIAETQRQHRSFKPNLPIQHPQSKHPYALTASAIRHAKIKSP
jgi:hypothetical protein